MEVSAKDNSKKDIDKAMDFLYKSLLDSNDNNISYDNQKSEIIIWRKILADWERSSLNQKNSCC